VLFQTYDISNEMRDKLLDSNDSEFSETDVSINVDFGAQEYDALLLDVGDKSSVGDNVYVNNYV